MTKEQFDILFSWAGSQAQLARLVGVSRSTVTQWLRRGYIPAGSGVVIERASLGKFKAAEMSERHGG
jgi:DNA-binding transcriptional regulator YdaS (Cro superfamily)